MTNELACGGTVGNNLVFLVRKHGTQPIQEARIHSDAKLAAITGKQIGFGLVQGKMLWWRFRGLSLVLFVPILLKTIKLHGSSLLMEVLVLGGLGTPQGPLKCSQATDIASLHGLRFTTVFPLR